MVRTWIPAQNRRPIAAAGIVMLAALLATTLTGCGGQQAAAQPGPAARAQSSSAPADPPLAPTPAPSLPTAEPAAPAIQIDVASYAVYPYGDPNGSTGLRILGEAVNRGDGPASDVQVTIALLDAGGRELASGTGRVNPRLAPGARFPFNIWMETAPREGWKSVRIETNGQPASPGEASQDYWDLKAESVTVGVDQSKRVVVTGMLTNVGAQAVQVSVPVIAYDAAGKLIDLASAYAAGELAPGAESAFSATFEHLSEPPARTEVVGFGMTVPGESPAQAILPPSASDTTAAASPVDVRVTEYRQYTDSDGRVVVVGLVKNSGQGPVRNVAVTLTLLDDSGRAVGAGAAQVAYPMHHGVDLPFRVAAGAPKGGSKQIVLAATGEPATDEEVASVCFGVFPLKGAKSTRDPEKKTLVEHGMIRNDEGRPIRDLQLFFVRRDADERLVDVAMGYTEPRDLTPGEEASYSLAYGFLTDYIENGSGTTQSQAFYSDVGPTAVAQAAATPTETPPPTPASVRVEEAAPTFTPAPSPTPMPTPEVKLAVASYRTYDNGVSWVGEVENRGDVPAESWRVMIAVLDASGAPLLSVDTPSWAYRLNPGEKLPFSASKNQVSVSADGSGAWVTRKTWTLPGFASAQTGVEGRPADPASRDYRELQMEGVTAGLDPTSKQPTMSGRIKNTGGVLVESVMVFATAYDEQGKVSDVAVGMAHRGPLMPGASLSFSIGFGNLKDPPADYVVTARARTAS